jgi:hypothetical protein
LEVIHGCGIQGLVCNMVVYGNKETIEYEDLLDEGRFGFSLSHRFKSYVTEWLQCFDKIFSYYKSRIYMRKKDLPGYDKLG